MNNILYWNIAVNKMNNLWEYMNEVNSLNK